MGGAGGDGRYFVHGRFDQRTRSDSQLARQQFPEGNIAPPGRSVRTRGPVGSDGVRYDFLVERVAPQPRLGEKRGVRPVAASQRFVETRAYADRQGAFEPCGFVVAPVLVAAAKPEIVEQQIADRGERGGEPLRIARFHHCGKIVHVAGNASFLQPDRVAVGMERIAVGCL